MLLVAAGTATHGQRQVEVAREVPHERTVLLIRQKIPGVPDEGSIPLRTWIIMGVLLVVFTGGSIVFGDDISRWLAGLWGDPDRIFG